jgi:MFS family permease
MTDKSVSNNSGERSGMKYPWAVFVALAMGMLVYGVAESYGPVFAIGGIIPAKYAFLGLSLPYIAGGVGALLSGGLADRIGRKGSFMITSGMIVVGIGIYALGQLYPSTSLAYLVTLIVSFILIGMAAIGLETPILSMMAEAVPAKSRGKSLVIVQNFGNIGVGITFIPLLLGFTGIANEAALILLFFAPLVALAISWRLMSESAPWNAIRGGSNIDVEDAWQEQDGKAEKVRVSVGLPMRFLILILIGVAQDVAFVYFSYGVGYDYFNIGIATSIPVIGGLTMAVVGVVAGLLFVDKVSRKSFTIFSYGILVGLWALLWVFEAITRATTGLLLLAVMTLLFIPGEITWASRGMLEPELFPTMKRGTYVSVVRFTVWVSAGVITGLLTWLAENGFSFNSSAAIVMVVFVVSLAMTVLWQRRGFETKSLSLSGLDKTIPKLTDESRTSK